MRVQVAFIVVASIGGILAMPFFYEHRMNDRVFTAGMLTFAGIPLIAGMLQRLSHRSVTLVAIGFLILCPLVYVVTDPLDAHFERLRDGFFLATGSTFIFVSTVWIRSSFGSRKLAHLLAAVFGLLSATVVVFVLLWMVMYFE